MSHLVSVPKSLISAPVGHRAFRVLMGVAAHADENGECNPSNEALSEVTGLSRTHVSDALRELAESDLIDLITIGRERRIRIVGHSQNGNVPKTGMFPEWEGNIPKSGREHSQIGNVPMIPPPAPPLYGESSSKKKKISNKRGVLRGANVNSPYTESFERFWNVFPRLRRRDKPKAWKAWKNALKRVTAETLIAAATEYAESDLGRGEFAKMPSSWLNAGAWEDDRAAWGDGTHEPARRASVVVEPDEYHRVTADTIRTGRLADG